MFASLKWNLEVEGRSVLSWVEAVTLPLHGSALGSEPGTPARTPVTPVVYTPANPGRAGGSGCVPALPRACGVQHVLPEVLGAGLPPAPSLLPRWSLFLLRLRPGDLRESVSPGCWSLCAGSVAGASSLAPSPVFTRNLHPQVLLSPEGVNTQEAAVGQ